MVFRVSSSSSSASDATRLFFFRVLSASARSAASRSACVASFFDNRLSSLAITSGWVSSVVTRSQTAPSMICALIFTPGHGCIGDADRRLHRYCGAFPVTRTTPIALPHSPQRM
jgi:hypothetical protein